MDAISDNEEPLSVAALGVIGAATAAASGTRTPARTLAAACDALLQTVAVADISAVARASASKNKSAKKSRKRKQTQQFKVTARVERGAYIDAYSRYASQQEIEDVRMAVQYEPKVEAVERKAAAAQKGNSIMTHALFKEGNESKLAAVGFKLEMVLDGIDPEWSEKDCSYFNGIRGCARGGKGLAGAGGWNKVGLDGTTDTIFGSEVKVNAAVRGALLKGVLGLGSRAPPAFFKGERRVRRAPVFDAVWGNQDANARAQRYYVEQQAAKGRNTLNFGGGAAKSLYSGGEYKENPVMRFKNSKVVRAAAQPRLGAVRHRDRPRRRQGHRL